MKSLPIGEVLKEYGYINEEQLQIALDAQKKDRSKRLGEHLIDLGFVSEQHMFEALSDKLDEPLVSLDNIDFDINSVKTARSVLKCYTHVHYINLTERRNFFVLHHKNGSGYQSPF